jgi:c-di-GMP-binding flagellar brake protein YcgR
MLFHRETHTAFAEDAGAFVDLHSMVSLQGRLVFTAASRQLVHVPCIVLSVDRKHIVVEVHKGVTTPALETDVILEVAQQTALVQCFTELLSKKRNGHLALRTPGHSHVLQRRRFQRVDLFIGVTLRTKDFRLDQTAAQMINLSMDGAALVVVESLPIGTECLVDLTAIGLHPGEAHAVVIRSTPTPSRLWVVGMKFDRLEAEQEIYLGKYINDVSERQGF